MFRSGQKVVYIGPDFSSHPKVVLLKVNVPVANVIYSIRGFAQRFEGPGYLLNEIHNVPRVCPINGLCEIAIDAKWLRPLVERKTDISVFQRMLEGRKVEA